MMSKIIPRLHEISCSTLIMLYALTGCAPDRKQSVDNKAHQKEVINTAVQDTLAPPFATESVKNYCELVPWPAGVTPMAPPDFVVTKFASDFKNPRWMYVTPNGDVLVAEASTEAKGVKKVAAELSGKAEAQSVGESANQITLLRDRDHDGVPEVRQVFLQNLKQPFGMLVIGNSLYVANTDAVLQFPYQPGQTEIKSEGKKIMDLPAGGYNNHWTRNIITNAGKNKIYVSVGSGSNVAEHGLANEIRRACILEANLDGGGERIYAGGLRNPTGMAWAPGTHDLWTVVNERDELGDHLVPDYLTYVKPGGFYGWPFAYIGPNKDPRMEETPRPDLVAQTLVPDVLMDAHSSCLGLVFYTQRAFPEKYRQGAFVAQHGSWNRSTLSGYKVVFVPFRKGKPAGKPEDFLTGFIASEGESKVYGRPVGLAILRDGSMLVSDDGSNTVWRIPRK